MKNSREIDDLKPYVAYLCRQLIEKCKANGFGIMVTSTVRDQESQTRLYNQGRKTKGNIVTNAKYIGPHGYGLAFDICVMANGKCVWDRDDLFKKAGKIGKALGLEWAGDWKSFKESCHFQYVGGLSTAELRAGHLPKCPPTPKYDMTIKDAIPRPQLKVINTGTTIPPVLNCYPSPSTKGQPNGKVQRGTSLNIYRQAGDWYLVNAVNAQWVKKEFIKIKGEK